MYGVAWHCDVWCCASNGDTCMVLCIHPLHLLTVDMGSRTHTQITVCIIAWCDFCSWTCSIRISAPFAIKPHTASSTDLHCNRSASHSTPLTLYIRLIPSIAHCLRDNLTLLRTHSLCTTADAPTPYGSAVLSALILTTS